MRKVNLLKLSALSLIFLLVGCGNEESTSTPANIYLPENYYEIPITAGDYNLPINIDQPFTVKSNKAWLTTAGSGNAMNGNFKFTVAENEDEEIRIGSLTIDGGGTTELVTMKQMMNNAIDAYSSDRVRDNEINNIGSMGGDYAIAVLYGLEVDEDNISKSDVQYSIPADADWVTVEMRKGRNDIDNPVNNLRDTVIIIVEPNLDGISDRETVITFTNDDYNLDDEITIHQTAEPSFEMLKRTYELARDASNAVIGLRSNAILESVTASEEWVKVPTSFEDVYDMNFEVTLDPNTSGVSRSATVTFLTAQQQTAVATITQMGQYTNKSESYSIVVSGVEREIEIPLLTGVNVVTAVEGVHDWLTIEKVGNDAIVTVLQNNGSERSATVTIADASNSSRKDIIEIVQGPMPKFEIADDLYILPVYNDYVSSVDVEISHPYQIRSFSSTWLNISATEGEWSEEPTTMLSGESLYGSFYIKPLEPKGSQEDGEVIVRTGTIQIASEGITKSINVKQISNNIIDISNNNYGVLNEGQNLSFGIVDGITYDYTVTGSTPAWVSITNDEANDLFNINFTPNGNDNRYLEIVFEDKENNKVDTINFIQFGAGKEIVLDANNSLASQIGANENLHIYTMKVKGEMTLEDFATLRGENSAVGRFQNLNVLDLSEMTNTIIPDTAVINMLNLTEVILPEGVIEIKEGAFSNNAKLAKINIPSGVTALGEGAFKSCFALDNITIPAGVTVLSEQLFYQTGIVSIEIPKNVVEIGSSAFSACAELTEVTFEEGSKLKTIASFAFFVSPKLVSISVPSGVDFIGSSAFASCRSLTNVDIKSTQIDIISEECFAGTNIGTIEFPSTVKGIGVEAFARARITDLVIPASVIYFGERSFLDIISDETEGVVEITLQRYDASASTTYDMITRFSLGTEAGNNGNTFSNSGPPEFPDKLRIYVPKGSLETYRTVVCTGEGVSDNQWGEAYIEIFQELSE